MLKGKMRPPAAFVSTCLSPNTSQGFLHVHERLHHVAATWVPSGCYFLPRLISSFGWKPTQTIEGGGGPTSIPPDGGTVFRRRSRTHSSLILIIFPKLGPSNTGAQKGIQAAAESHR